VLEGHEFCDHCPGCRPVIFNPVTGQVYPLDSPVMKVVNRIWDHDTTYAERKAFIEVALHNSRQPEHLRLAQAVTGKMQAALASEERSRGH
jgi:hypothetical protein